MSWAGKGPRVSLGTVALVLENVVLANTSAPKLCSQAGENRFITWLISNRYRD